ncbi:hypothetical protein HHK36_023112 [Tetracentron sinense]|uniref:Uncharacterized protein n=1 Tax=Tetracentron sinense TaxID=13715 RepID=A0A835D4Y9_TETSI|nr:hypothetical protein HHK36_023112 [Tetracentron sinense]
MTKGISFKNDIEKIVVNEDESSKEESSDSSEDDPDNVLSANEDFGKDDLTEEAFEEDIFAEAFDEVLSVKSLLMKKSASILTPPKHEAFFVLPTEDNDIQMESSSDLVPESLATAKLSMKVVIGEDITGSSSEKVTIPAMEDISGQISFVEETIVEGLNTLGGSDSGDQAIVCSSDVSPLSSSESLEAIIGMYLVSSNFQDLWRKIVKRFSRTDFVLIMGLRFSQEPALPLSVDEQMDNTFVSRHFQTTEVIRKRELVLAFQTCKNDEDAVKFALVMGRGRCKRKGCIYAIMLRRGKHHTTVVARTSRKRLASRPGKIFGLGDCIRIAQLLYSISCLHNLYPLFEATGDPTAKDRRNWKIAEAADIP